jgi:hypothetical protein
MTTSNADIKTNRSTVYMHIVYLTPHGISKSHQCIEVKYLFYVRLIVSNANVLAITEIINKGIQYNTKVIKKKLQKLRQHELSQ